MSPGSEKTPTTLGQDLAAGLVVTLVALPLCLGIALASGAPLVAGLVTGVLGGVLLSWMGGTHLLVSGPAAGLAAIVLSAIDDLGSFEALLAALVVAGVIQTLLGLMRFGRLAALVPSSVVTGMLAAIGVLLLLQQLPHALGAPHEKAHGLELLRTPFHAIAHAQAGPAIVAAVALALLALFDLPALDRVRRFLPGPLAAVVAGTLVAEGLAGTTLALPASLKVSLPSFQNGFAHVLDKPDWSVLWTATTWQVAITLAIVASLESLLSMEATDRLDPLRRRSNADRELVAQGVGNTIAGLVGGLPMTGVIVRSAANISAGGRTWRASFVHGVLLMAAVLALPDLLSHVPLAALAAVLLNTGWKLAHPKRFAAAGRVGFQQLVPQVATVLAVVATDLLIGVFTGLVVALGLALRHGGRPGRIEVTEELADTPRVRLHLPEAVSFVHKQRLSALLDGVPEGSELHVDGSRSRAIDHDVAELLHAFRDRARARRIDLQLVGVPSPHPLSSH